MPLGSQIGQLRARILYLVRRLLPVRATRTWLGPQAPQASSNLGKGGIINNNDDDLSVPVSSTLLLLKRIHSLLFLRATWSWLCPQGHAPSYGKRVRDSTSLNPPPPPPVCLASPAPVTPPLPETLS